MASVDTHCTTMASERFGRMAQRRAAEAERVLHTVQTRESVVPQLFHYLIKHEHVRIRNCKIQYKHYAIALFSVDPTVSGEQETRIRCFLYASVPS
ncbi:hypothetical protein JOB18_008227 [Solea senegalensis]|uniref:Uncharacterized protein n=1 Tax=Solea senegalensis TaxID=28829 RepID=A0AAV6RIJ3_SOLSE|nr:hypothetical protein JOB18_008227 [Solea senegalensis]